MKNIIQLNCQHCIKSFSVSTTEFKRSQSKFCSRICAGNSRKGKKISTPNKECSLCKTTFHISKSKMKNSKSGLYFCSRSCKDIAQRIESNFLEIQPSHYQNGEFTYREKAFRLLPNECAMCTYKKYIEILQVHHIDRDRSNNNIENLIILCSRCHDEEHFLAKDGKWCSH